jgi:hypothetical protein
MNRAERKAAAAAYKEQPPVAGVFAVRCTATGQVWVGVSQRLDKHKNMLWPGLISGRYPHPGLQSVFTAHGEASFSFEPLEEMPTDLSAYELKSRLKDRAAYWRETLGAAAI